MAAPTGTISWFKIADGELPPINMTTPLSRSNALLIANDEWIDVAYYVHERTEWVHDGTWEPKYWAFINWPA